MVFAYMFYCVAGFYCSHCEGLLQNLSTSTQGFGVWSTSASMFFPPVGLVRVIRVLFFNNFFTYTKMLYTLILLCIFSMYSNTSQTKYVTIITVFNVRLRRLRYSNVSPTEKQTRNCQTGINSKQTHARRRNVNMYGQTDCIESLSQR